MGSPKSSKILPNPKQSSPKYPLGRYLVQPLKKHQKFMILGYPETLKNWISQESGIKTHYSHRTRKRQQKYLQNASFWAPFGHLGRPNAAFWPFRGSLKFCVFLEGSRCSLLLQNVLIFGPSPINYLAPFWHLF